MKRELTDQHGRVWTHKPSDPFGVGRSDNLYVHDQMAWTDDMVLSDHALPSRKLASNPNYRLCSICTKEW